ncbi:AAA family ATPase [Microbacterium sp.]|uniref:AAA family ATPase n=1 Tax=Microbacterium sp. TaxID=51671 RepID=UPI0027340E10|nr:AAA family ATPase [Microbacterium sp.]MDP3952988.1 AAA family ATPase [Microbacterium sp.]
MLEQLTITGGACFGAEPLVIQPLHKVNFFFGSNGSGKTTISRALAGNESLETDFTWHDSSPMTIRVYNRDFVDRTLRESSRIPGVFVIGDKSVEAEERLAAIERDGGERAQAEADMGRARNSLTQMEQADADAKTAFLESAWSAYKAFIDENPALSPAFSGTGGVGRSKQALVDRLLAHVTPEKPAPSLESLTTNADAVFDTSATAYPELPAIPSFDAASFDGYSLLPERVVGSDAVTLSELVGQWGNSDWVATGRQYLQYSGGHCPFCQQQAPANLLTELSSMFDDHYASQRDAVEQFRVAFSAWSAGALSASDGYDSSSRSFLDGVAYQAALLELEKAVSTNSATLDRKMQNLSEPVEYLTLDATLAAITDVIDDANQTIRDHNALIANRRTERPKLTARCWRYLAEVLLGTPLANLKEKQASRNRGIQNLKDQIKDAETRITELDDEVRDLHRSVESTRPVIDQINAILERSGFTSFKIVESPSLEDGYMLSRGDGELQEHSLSEGERTFIAFLYYFHLLAGRASESDESYRILAVIDDPISSLDSDVLFVVGALVRHLIGRAVSGEDRIEQVLVLTHNVYFHKEISHLQNGESPSGRVHFLIRKRPSSPSTLTSSRKNPVTTEYRRLWDEVKRAIDGEQMNVIGLENILRRILEGYFRVMGGGIWDDEITPLLTESERLVFRALFRWVNEGSHSILEDVYYSPSPISQDLYLQVFQRIFEVTKHDAHYRMMLYGKRSITEVEESASAGLADQQPVVQ